VVALLAERPQRGVEDPLLRPSSSGADTGVVGERGAATDRDGTLRVLFSLVVGHLGLLALAAVVLRG
jgi:hypothetical protein